MPLVQMVPPLATLAHRIRLETRALSPEDVADYVHALELSAEALAAAYHGGELPACDLILPDGAYANLRKDLSHRGMVRLEPGRPRWSTDWYDDITQQWYMDPTNYAYGCAGRYLKQFLVPTSALHYELSRLGDVKIGDIFEALLGLAWLARIRDPEEYEVSVQNRTTLLIERFVWCMVDLLAALRRNAVTRDLGNSRFFADFMLRI